MFLRKMYRMFSFVIVNQDYEVTTQMSTYNPANDPQCEWVVNLKCMSELDFKEKVQNYWEQQNT